MKILQRTIRRKRGKHCARIRFEDDEGTIHEIMRTAENKSAAKTRLAQLEVEILEKGTARLERKPFQLLTKLSFNVNGKIDGALEFTTLSLQGL